MLNDKAKKKLQKQGMQLFMKLMDDERTQPYVTKLMQTAMQSRESLMQIRQEVAETLQLATLDQFNTLRRKAEKLERKLDALNKELEEQKYNKNPVQSA